MEGEAMKLVIAEKPSVAIALAAVLGANRKRDGYLEGGGYLVSWCFGHLVRMASPDEYDPAYAKWRRDVLPIIPNPFEYRVIAEKQRQYEILKSLMHREDVAEVINACDAGREGELIFRTAYSLAQCQKEVKRLWISSMEEQAIREGFAHLHPGEEFEGLYRSAQCRAEADWLVGINASRFFSLVYGAKLNIGRVVSPTLAMLVQRDGEISSFVPQKFYTVHLTGKLNVTSERMEKSEDALRVASDCMGRTATVTAVSRAERAEHPPKLYDLTALQRDANRLLGYTAQQTLDYLQALYEKKLCTYPRTDSRYLTDDMEELVPELVGIASQICGIGTPSSQNARQICNSRKVSDHHALLPTAEAAKADLTQIPSSEMELLKLLSLGLLKAVDGVHRYAETTVQVICEGTPFSVKGKTVLSLGWKEYDHCAEEPPLPECAVGDSFPVIGADAKEGETTPPKPFTEDTLLLSMEKAGDLPEESERKGLGTPATRAGILEKLVAEKLAFRKKEKKRTTLHSTPLGMALITILPEQLQSPQLTAQWEQELLEIQSGRQSPEMFRDGICAMLRELFAEYIPVPGGEILFREEKRVVGKCPRCGSNVTEGMKGFFCEKAGCGFALWKNNRFFEAKRKILTAAMVSELLKSGSVLLKDCYSPRTGRTYGARVMLEDNGQEVRFRMVFDNG